MYNVFYLCFLLMMGLGFFYATNNLVAQVPQPEATATPTAITNLPDTPTPPSLLPSPTPSPSPAPSSTPTADFENLLATPTATSEVANNSAGTPPNCPIPGSIIRQPGNGARVNGIITIQGEAYVENFDYYKIEFRALGGEWHFIQDYHAPVGSGALGTWNTDSVAPGEYDFQLVVVDKIGNYPTPCQIRLIVQ